VPNKHVHFLTFIAVLCFCRSAWGQTSEADSVKGELRSSAILRAQATLTDLHGARPVAEVPVGGDGQFEFRHILFGDYRLTIVDAAGQPIHQEWLAVHDHQQPIEVAVTVRDEPRPASGTVSVQELLHPPAKKAFKAFVAAQKFSEAGDHEKAAAQLDKAIELSPDYAAAWANLGAQQIFLKHFEQALQDLTRASEISGPTAMILSNLGYAQYMLYRYAAGTQSVREALRLDPQYVQAHYLLGAYLVLDRRTRAEGIQHLEVAAVTMQSARAELDRAGRELSQVVTHP